MLSNKMNGIVLFFKFLFIKFILCFAISELSILKRRINLLFSYCLLINPFKYLLYLFGKNILPFRSKKLNEYIYVNKKKWLNEKSKKVNKFQKKIIIENHINQPLYSVTNIVIGKYLELIENYSSIGLLRKGDLTGKLLFESFGIKKIYYYSFGGIFTRVKYLFRALSIIKKINSMNSFLKFKINNVDIGLITYDTFLRYTRTPTSNTFDLRLINFLAEGLHSLDYFNDIVKDEKITALVQSEKQFIPLNIFFQKFLTKKNRRVYSRFGTDRISVRTYCNFDQGYENKARFSNKVLNYVFKNKKYLAIKEIDKFFNFQFNSNLYGKSWAPWVSNNKKTISQWKNQPEKTKYSKNKELIKIKLINISRKEICNQFNWNIQKKIVTVFLPYAVDGNYHNGKKILFKDNYSWSIGTINLIRNIKHINWIIKIHPEERRNNSNNDFSNLLEVVIKKNSHIKTCPLNLKPHSLTKITDVALTSHGTAGMEYQSFGIPSIVSEKSPYNHFGFLPTPNNLKEYLTILKNMHKLTKPSKKNIIKAKIALFTNYELSKTYLSYIPASIPKFDSRMSFNDREEFWKQMINRNKKFNFKKDNFFKMFKIQILLKNRHTINFDKYKIKYRKFNDLYE